ncbi:MAG TPA: purine-nucleoside phosphorylase [Acidimicrobiales bacterium]|nr:purine-nucleoside phosphorylase [Acidimicrobiales bacterium]
MPTTSARGSGADPFEQARFTARALSRRVGVHHHDALVVLGTGLSPVAEQLGAEGPPVDLAALPWFPRFTGLGHKAEAWSVNLEGVPTLVVAGRVHLYEGRTTDEVVQTVRMAVATGVSTIVLTCNCGAIRADLEVGSVVLVADHLNLTATSPLTGSRAARVNLPFVDLTDAWSPHLRDLAREVEPDLPEGVYAQMPGPHFETPAEIRMLALLGADMVGMSMALEAIAARHLGAEVLGLAVVGNAAAGSAPGPIDAADIQASAGAAVDEVARIVRGVVGQLKDDPPET